MSLEAIEDNIKGAIEKLQDDYIVSAQLMLTQALVALEAEKVRQAMTEQLIEEQGSAYLKSELKEALEQK